MPLSFENMCRTCMLNESKQQEMANKNKVKMKTPQMVSIFTVPEEAKEKLNLMELIKTTVPQLKIDENDQLPKNVCVECSEKIKEMYNFQQTCLSNEHKFYKMLEGDDDAINPFNDTEDHEDVFKTEFDDSFIEENSLQTDEEMIMEEEINRAAEAKEEFIESYSDCSIDLVWDDDNNSDADWNEKKVTSKLKKNKKHKTELVDDEIFNVFCAEEKNEDDNNHKDDEEFKSSTTKGSTKEMKTKGNYPCKRCKKILKTKVSLLRHEGRHEKRDKEGRKYVCNICNKAFHYGSILRKHQRKHVGERPYLCSECGKGFTSSGSLKEHSLRHLKEKLFPCPDCPRSFPTKTDMLSHYDIHKAKPRKHICDVCGRGFYKPYLLKQHKMYHNNERPFACEYCDKSFVTHEKVKRHTRIHTGEKPYKCNYCVRTYCQSTELMKHLRSHLGENVYQCELCPVRLKTVKLLRSHFATHKNDDEETKARNLAELNALEMKGMFIK
ncbi:zinc finger protein 34-like isoform X3 [Lucilia cuprina]|uniref:zinc finger protein 34-like isoform X3 n=1 Tax=Lucilia cuprina TaxID=7375 RepID=UPI001F05C562|nr:zinc finger protein 34-like isoform X3 [Lucilia cuprina]